MKLHTEVNIPKFPFQLNYNERIFLTGSCFAGNIGQLLKENKFDVLVNPYGILYNPVSIVKSIVRIINNESYDESDLTKHDNIYHSFDHHGEFSDVDASKAVEKINRSLHEAHSQLKSTSLLILSLGTSFVYEYIAENRIVANCHKIADREFRRSLLNPGQISSQLHDMQASLKNFNPTINLLLTVSPVRHFRDGMVSNQRSKAALILAAHDFAEKNSDVFYFPSYEIMMDELRDYRFYDEDLVHPSVLAVQIIWERFYKSIFSDETVDLMNNINFILKAKYHRPINPESEGFRIFAQNQIEKINELKGKYPFLDLEQEMEYFKTLV